MAYCKDGCFNRPERWEKRDIPGRGPRIVCKVCGKIIGRDTGERKK